MRILMVTGIFPPDRGGPASYVPLMAEALSRRGHAVEVVCLSDLLTEHGQDVSIPVHRIRRGQFWPLRVAKTVFVIWRAARHHDVVYVNGLGAESALAALLARRPAVHKIVGDYAWERAVGRRWFRGTIDDYQASPKSPALRILDLIRSMPLKLARRIIVPSEYLRHIAVGWGIPNSRIQVIHNAVARAIATTPGSVLPAWAGHTLITVCRLVPWKGVDALIRLLPELPDTRLAVAGDGYIRGELSELATRVGVAARVHFLGDVRHEEVAGYLRQADAFVLNSTYEGLPHVVLEAMSAGVPVIATNAGGTSEVVEHNVTGLLVPVGNPVALRAAVERLWREPSVGRQLSVEAQRRLQAHFDVDTMVGSTEAVLAAEAGVTTAEPRALSVLSFGFTRGLWEGDSAEDVQRLRSYAAQLDEYVVVANSYKHHRLLPVKLAANFTAIPTDAYSVVDSFLRMIQIGWRVLRSRRISLIQAQDPCSTGLAAVLLAWWFGQPVCVCVYGPNVYDPHWIANHWSHRFLGMIGRWVLRRAQGIQVDGRMTAHSLIAAGCRPERVFLKPVVPANLDRFLAIYRRPDDSREIVRLLYAGRLAHQKNLKLLLAVVRALHQAGCAAFRLRIVGGGPMEAMLREMVERDDLTSLVEFRGPVSRDEIVGVFAQSDVFVLSSDYEGYPRVLMEAAAAALPIITTAVSGSDEAVRDGETGFIVPIGAVAEFAARTRLLIDDPELRARQGAAARTHVRAQLDPTANAANQLKIWRNIAEPSDATLGPSTLVFAEKP